MNCSTLYSVTREGVVHMPSEAGPLRQFSKRWQVRAHAETDESDKDNQETPH